MGLTRQTAFVAGLLVLLGGRHTAIAADPAPSYADKLLDAAQKKVTELQTAADAANREVEKAKITQDNAVVLQERDKTALKQAENAHVAAFRANELAKVLKAKEGLAAHAAQAAYDAVKWDIRRGVPEKAIFDAAMERLCHATQLETETLAIAAAAKTAYEKALATATITAAAATKATGEYEKFKAKDLEAASRLAGAKEVFEELKKITPEPAKPTKPEPAKPEPAKPEPAKPEPAKPEPAKPEPAKPDLTKPNTAKPDPQKPDPAKSEPPKSDPLKTDPPTPAPAPTVVTPKVM